MKSSKLVWGPHCVCLLFVLLLQRHLYELCQCINVTKRILSGCMNKSNRWFKNYVVSLMNDGIKLLSIYLVR